MTNLQYIAAQVTAPQKSIEATLQLLYDDCTIPFIARYRKDKTGNPDEVVIEQIAKLGQAYDGIDRLIEKSLIS
jgi:protein Tex